MKGIVSLYVEMLRDMGLTTILECKRRITKADLCYHRITPEQHRTKYLYQALKHITKTSPRAELSVSENVVERSRRRMLAKIELRLKTLPSDHTCKTERESLRRTRELIESQITPAAGMA
ncbi:unnamed protein product [marine sediment metagenome]|uniref:Uncharacterized protein n=1 Tax=marine sediment metagenome TaxID=412755 RepID=X1JHR7_9ZZZZ